jgi:uncharacterized membrane protein
MKKPRYEYKEHAKNLLAGKYEKPIIVLLVFYVVNLILGSIVASTATKYSSTVPFQVVDPGNPALNTLFTIIQFLVGAAIAYATVKMAIEIYKERPVVPEEIMLVGFKNNFLRNAFMQFMRSLFIFLWSLLLLIPGIIKAYAYSMVFYLVNKEPELEAMAAIDKSKNLTRGYKADLFLLDLSYLGWYILGIFTLGILWLWVIPKHQVARVMYFEEIYLETYPPKAETLPEFEE